MKSMALKFAIFVLLHYSSFMLFCYLGDHTERGGMRGTGDSCVEEDKNVYVEKEHLENQGMCWRTTTK